MKKTGPARPNQRHGASACLRLAQTAQTMSSSGSGTAVAFVSRDKPSSTPATGRHALRSSPMEKAATVANQRAATCKSIAAKWAWPKSRGMQTRLAAAMTPAESP